MDNQNQLLSSDNEEKRNKVSILIKLIWASWSVFLIVMFVALYTNNWQLFAVLLASCILLIAPFVLLRRGNMQASSPIIALIMICTITLISIVGQGIRDLVLIAFPIIFIFAGLTLSRLFFRLYVGLAVATVGWLSFGETYGWFVTKPFNGENANWLYLFYVTIILLVAALAVELLATNLQNNLANAKLEIAQRKQAEAALVESQALTTAIVESTSDLIWSVDPEKFGLLTYNHGLSDYFLRGREIAIQAGMRPEDLFPPGEFVQKWRGFYQRVLTEGSYTEEYHAYSGTVTLQLTFNILIRDDKVFGISVFGRDITEIKQAEEAVKQQEQRFHALFQNIETIAVQGYSMEGTTLYWNDASEKIYGYSSEEAIGRDLLDLIIPPEMRDGVKQAIQHMASTGELIPASELSLMKKDGSRVSVYSSHVIVTNPGFPPELFCLDVELTERKQAEKLLKDIIFKNPMSIQVFDKEGFLLEANPAQKMLFGSVPPSDYSIFNDPQLVQSGMGEVFDKLRNGEEVHFPDVKFNAHDSVPEMPDVPVWVRTIGFPLFDTNEKPDRFILMHENITERQQAEEARRASEKKYQELFQVNKDGIAIFLVNPYGPPSTFVEFNDAAHRMLGYTREEMLQFSPMVLEPYTTQEQIRSRQSELNLKGSLDFETILQHKNGHQVYAEFATQVIQYEGKPAVMNIVRDISERKQRENELNAIAILGVALRSAPTRSDMLPVIVEQLSGLLNSDAISIEIIDPITKESVTEAASGVWTSVIGFRQPPGTGLDAVISETKKSYINNNLQDEPNIIAPANFLEESILAGAGVPLIAQNQLIGYLWMGRKEEIAESEVRLLAAVADIAANAIHRATLHELTREDAANLKEAYESTLEGWVKALELRDQETEWHARNVVELTVELARAVGISENEMDYVRRGALLHDIGKMGVPDSVLLKPGTLNDREWEIMRRHPEYAYNLLEPIEYLRPVLDIPYCHHEKWDGSGYPRGLKGEEIPLMARVFAIVDVWDALMSDRPYRKAWSFEQAYKHIQEQSGTHFDPIIVAAFIEMLDKQHQ